jgi:hypothetical protein
MKRSVVTMVSLVVGLLFPLVWAVERPFATGKILDIQQKTRSRVLYNLVNTPVTQDDPYYEVTVQLSDTVYVGEYTPVRAKQTLPADWQVDSEIQARVEKRTLFLKQPGETELKFVIVKRKALAAAGAPAQAKH